MKDGDINNFIVKDGHKMLILVRHAKSSWTDSNQKDFDRPLNERGKREAPEMAKRLIEKILKPDAFISSPAKRALSTCEYFIKEFGGKNKEIIQAPELYEAAITTFFQVVSQINNDFNSVIIFSHNPGITGFANQLTEAKIDDMPACSVFAVSAETKDWKGFQNAAKKFLFFDHPKNNH